jgi:hypothetical protein
VWGFFMVSKMPVACDKKLIEMSGGALAELANAGGAAA